VVYNLLRLEHFKVQTLSDSEKEAGAAHYRGGPTSKEGTSMREYRIKGTITVEIDQTVELYGGNENAAVAFMLERVLWYPHDHEIDTSGLAVEVREVEEAGAAA
jgi:hypothetical protein